MISNIHIEEFRKRLQLNTKRGNPKISGSPLHIFNMTGEKNKVFYGSLKHDDFQITTNATLYPIPYILKGNIKPRNSTQTEVLYEIIPIRFGYYWNRFLPLLMLIIFNIVLFTKKAPTLIFAITNFSIIIIYLIANLTMNYKRRNFEKRFKAIFEIN